MGLKNTAVRSTKTPHLTVGATIGRPPLNRLNFLAAFLFDTPGVLIVGVDVLDDPKAKEFPLRIGVLPRLNILPVGTGVAKRRKRNE